MNQEEFENLQKLLRLKRHETPPPGYFRDFSKGVLARVRRLEAENPQPLPLWRRLLAPWSPSARLVWANSLTVAGLGIVGFSLYFSYVTGPKPASEGMTAAPQLGGVGFSAASGTSPRVNGSLLFVAEPVEMEGIRIPSLEMTQTNPFPQGLFQLPGDRSVRVGFGTPR